MNRTRRAICLCHLVAIVLGIGSFSHRALAQATATDISDGRQPVTGRQRPDSLSVMATASLPPAVDSTLILPPVAGVERSPSPTPDSAHASEAHPRLTQEEYHDLGVPRYTMDGHMPYRETFVQSGTLTAFGGALLGLATVITLYQQAWYPDSVDAFHFEIDWGYSKQLDKAGHFFGGWMSSYCSYEAFIASGLSQEDAAVWGSLGGLFFQTMMEVQDGFHMNYGFDWTDEASNMLGAAYFYAQREVPFLRNFDPKWSFGTSGRDSARDAAQIRSRLIVDDYDGQNVWISAKVHNLLPESMKPYWPKWLQLAIGVGAKDVELKGYEAYRTVHIALDYDLRQMIPDIGSFGNWLVQGLNNFHFPAPALQVYPDVKFHLFFGLGL